MVHIRVLDIVIIFLSIVIIFASGITGLHLRLSHLMRLPPAPPLAERHSERHPVNSLQDISKPCWFPPAAEDDEGGDDEDEDVVSAEHDQGDGGGVVHVGEWLLRSAVKRSIGFFT